MIICPWREEEVGSLEEIKFFIEDFIDNDCVVEIQNPVLHSNGLWGSIFFGKMDYITPETFSQIVVDSIPQISGLKEAYDSVKGTDDSTRNAYYSVIKNKIFKDFPYFEISCCNDESVLFPFISLDMLCEYMKSCNYFGYDKVREDKDGKNIQVTTLWYFKKGSKRYTSLHKPTVELPGKSIYFRYRIWESPNSFTKFSSSLGKDMWRDISGKQYSEISLENTKNFYKGCVEDLGKLV